MRDNAIRDGLLRALGAAHLHANWRIDRNSLSTLVSSLHPIDPGVPLVRIGPDGDGGYLVPDALDGIAHAFSPGVSTESGFEAELAERGMDVVVTDHHHSALGLVVDQAGRFDRQPGHGLDS